MIACNRYLRLGKLTPYLIVYLAGFFAFHTIVTQSTYASVSVTLATPFSPIKTISGRLAESLERAARTSNKQKNLIFIRGAAGEYENASIIISPEKKVTRLHLEASDLVGDMQRLSSEHVDIKYVQYWFQEAGAWQTHRRIKSKQPEFIPELLVKNPQLVSLDHQRKINLIKTQDQGYVHLSNTQALKRMSIKNHKFQDADKLQPLVVENGDPQEYLITIKIPDNIRPGRYRGTIRIQANTEYSSIPLKLEVLPFKLQPTPLLYSIYYRGKITEEQPLISSDWKTQAQLEIELTDIKNHGICCPTLYQRLYPKTAEHKKAALLENYIKHLQVRQAVGIDNKHLFYLGVMAGGPDSLNKNEKRFKRKIKYVHEVSKAFGVEKLFLYGVEERTAIEFQVQKSAWKAAQSLGHGIFVAGDKKFFLQKDPAVPDFLVYHNKVSKAAAKKAHDLGAKILSYANPQVGVENPYPYRENYGFTLLRNDFDGAMTYAYQDSMGMIWVDDDHKHYRDHAFTYPTTNGIISTLAWEAFREAVDDTRYYQTYLQAYNRLEIQKKEQLRAPKEILQLTESPDQVRGALISEMLELIALNEPVND